MIRTEREYKITKAQVAEFERTLGDLPAKAPPGVHPKIAQAQRDAVASQLQDLRAELADYDGLRTGREPVIEVRNLTAISQEGENVLLELMKRGVKIHCSGVFTKQVLRQLARRMPVSIQEGE